MEMQISKGRIPYEIGDIVKLKNQESLYKIHDIIFIQSVRNKSAEFEVLLYLEGTDFPKRCKADRIEKRIVPQPPQSANDGKDL